MSNNNNNNNILSMLLPVMLMKNDGDIKSKLSNTLLIFIVTSLVDILVKHYNTIYNLVLSFTKYKKRTIYEIKGNITYKNNTYCYNTLTLRYKAIMNFLYNKIINDSTNKVKYNILDKDFFYNNSNVKIVLFSNPNQVYNLTETIQVMHKHKSEKCIKDEFLYEEYVIHLSSTDNNIKKVVEFIEQAIIDYDKEQSKHLNKLKIYTLNGFHKETEEPNYKEVDFVSNKTFNNMFFEDKSKFIKRIKFFEKECKSEYERLGIPYTIGVLFHGEPGTGKTSAIKALANYTNRHIILIPIKKVNNADNLKQLFMSKRINDMNVPMDRRLYVFEEIDCSQLKNAVLSRKYKTNDLEENNSTYDADTLTECIKNALSTDKSKEKKIECDINLGDILEILDGMIEIPGRMLIMTSNHPELLDPALLRPGRIDLKVEFKKMTRYNIQDMYRLWFDKEIPDNIFKSMKDYVFSQADIGNLFSSGDQDYIFKTLAY